MVFFLAAQILVLLGLISWAGISLPFLLERNKMKVIPNPNKEEWDEATEAVKANGGYCEMLPDYKAPFVFANFNGTSGDIEVLTHECGHAFEGYLSARNYPHFAQRDITMDIAEIHSMSM